MAQINDQAQAGSGSEGATETASAGSIDSLNNPGKEQTFGERISGASSRADIDRLTREAIEAPAAKAPDSNGAPAGETEAGDGAPQTAEVETTKAEEGTSEADKQPAEEAQAEAAAEDAASKQAEEDEKLPDRMRLTNFTKVEKLALTIKKENPKLTLAEAEAKAKDALGIVEEAKPATEAGEKTADLPQSLPEVDAKIKALIDQRTKAYEEDLDFKAANRLTLEIEALKDHKLVLREQATRQAADAQAAYDAAFEAAEQKASALYDFMKQPESAAFKRMVEIDQQLKENKDPLFDAPDKTLIIAQMAARELQIAPRSPNAKAAPARPVVTTRPAVTTDPKKTVPPVASGTSRTTTASTQGDGLAKKIAELRTPADLDNFLAGSVKF